MGTDIFRRCVAALCALGVLLGGGIQAASAGMIGTQAVVAEQQRAAALEHVTAVFAQKAVRTQFEALGIQPEQARERVAALSDVELLQLEQQLRTHNAPAGGDVLAIIGGVFVVLLVLEFVGITDVFAVGP